MFEGGIHSKINPLKAKRQLGGRREIFMGYQGCLQHPQTAIYIGTSSVYRAPVRCATFVLLIHNNCIIDVKYAINIIFIYNI